MTTASLMMLKALWKRSSCGALLRARNEKPVCGLEVKSKGNHSVARTFGSAQSLCCNECCFSWSYFVVTKKYLDPRSSLRAVLRVV